MLRARRAARKCGQERSFHRNGVSWATKWSSKLPIDQSPGLTNPERSISFRGVCAYLIGRPRVARVYRCSFVRQDLAFQHHPQCHLCRDRAYIPQQLQADYLFEQSRSRRVGQGRAMQLLQLRNMTVDWSTARIHSIPRCALPHDGQPRQKPARVERSLERPAVIIRRLA